MTMILHASDLARAATCHGAAQACERARAAGLVRDRSAKTGADAGRRDHARIAELLLSAVCARQPAAAEPGDSFAVRECLAAITWPDFTRCPGFYIEDKFRADNIVGTPDFIVIGDDHADIYDWKTGWGANAPTAVNNVQLMAYAWLLFLYWDAIEHVGVHLCAPACPRPEQRYSHTEYARSQCEDITAAVRELTAACESPDAKRTPSAEACQFCDACGTRECPESQSVVTDVAKIDAEGLPTLPDDRLVALMDAARLAKRVADEIMAEGKRRMTAGELTTDQWMLRDGAVRHKIVGGAQETMGAMAELLPQASRFLAATSVSWPKLVAAVKEQTGMSEREARARTKVALGELLAESVGEPTLVRITK